VWFEIYKGISPDSDGMDTEAAEEHLKTKNEPETAVKKEVESSESSRLPG
jgi:hypothetical protein